MASRAASRSVIVREVQVHEPRCLRMDASRYSIRRDASQERDLRIEKSSRQQQTKENPLQMGIVGATDDHNGTPGYTREDAWNGHSGRLDDHAAARISGKQDGGATESIGFNPGGITGVWSEENTRDGIF